MKKKPLLIVGAGISGLSFAWYVRKQSPDRQITMVDAKETVGGVIRTIDEEFFFERGPRTLRPGVLLELAQEMGEEILQAPPLPRFIYARGALRPLSWTWRMGFSLIQDLCVKPQERGDESVYDFFVRHIGQKLTREFIDPFFTGIYAGDIQRLSIAATMPKLKEWDTTYGSLFKGFWKEGPRNKGLFTVKQGLEQFCQKLLQHSGAHFIPQQKIDIKAPFSEHLCSTVVPSHIPRKSLAVVNVAYRKKLPIPRGFGYLIPSTEQEKIKGVVFDSIVFPQQNRHREETRLTVVMDLQEEAEKVALDALQRHLQIMDPPDRTYVTPYPDAIVQPPLFHREKMAEEFPYRENITWLGTHLHGVSLSDSVLASKKAAEHL